MIAYILTVQLATKDDFILRYESEEDLKSFMDELTKQIEQNAYNNGFVELYNNNDEDGYSYYCRVNEIVGFEVFRFEEEEKKKWFHRK